MSVGTSSFRERTLWSSARLVWRKYLQQIWQNNQWTMLGVLATIIWWLGFVGFSKHSAATGGDRSILDRIYLAIQLFTLESGSVTGPKTWELEVARILAPLITTATAVKTFAVLFASRIHALRARLFFRHHLVICGLGRKGLLLARDARADQEQVIVLEQDPDNEYIAPCRETGALVLIGDATTPELLKTAQVARARHVVAVTGEDGVNAEIAVHAREVCDDRAGEMVNCLVHVVDPDFCQLLIEQELEAEHGDQFRLDFFNIFEQGAKVLLDERSPFLPGDAPCDGHPHIVAVGLGRLGENLVVQSAKRWIDRFRRTGKQLHISVVDRVANEKVSSLLLRYPKLSEVCRLFPVQLDVRSPQYQQADFLYDENRVCHATSVYICLDDDSAALTAGLVLLPRLRDQRIPIVVRMARDAGLATLLRGEERAGAFQSLYAFGLLDRTCTRNVLTSGAKELLARAVHASYVAQQFAEGKTRETNPSMAAWDDLPNDLKESNRRQADDIGAKLKSVNCGITLLDDWDEEDFVFNSVELEELARREHERWIEERRKAGWSFAPGPKDLARKTNPDLVPWEQLSEEARKKDLDSVGAIPRLLAQAGFQVCRRKAVVQPAG